MNKQFDKLAKSVLMILVVGLLILLAISYITTQMYGIIFVVFLVLSVFAFYIIFRANKINEDILDDIESTIEDGLKESYEYGETGSLIYDDDYTVVWTNSFLRSRNLDRKGEKLLTFLPEVDDLIANKADETEVAIENRQYRITKIEAKPLLILKDITRENELLNLYRQEKLVVGLIHFDNYEESTFYQDESTISLINTTVKQPVLEWCRKNGIIVKSLRSYRLFVVLNETIFEDLIKHRFDILNTVRNASKEIDTTITLSMAFAKGSSNILELDDTANELLDLAQTRGGDQVAVRTVGQDVKYYGGSSLATEKRSKVRVRIMTHTLRDLIMKSSNVIICGHKEMDADCIGSMLLMSRICHSFNKDPLLVAKSGGIEAMISGVLEKYDEHLKERHHFITENEALNQLNKDTLVIMMDHHYYKTSNSENLLLKANKVAILDHHRRVADLGINTVFVFVETAASSTCELTLEFLPYLANKVDISPIEANIMYLGIKIDTNDFKVRTGSRTFTVLASLRQYNADPNLCNELEKDNYITFIKRNNLISAAESYNDNILIASVDDGEVYSRTMLSQAADALLQIKGIEAAFVITNIAKDEVAISARSNSEFNVQIIMEKMNGGGHLNAAALQRKKEKVVDIKKELVEVLTKFLKKENSDESNIIEGR